jgi:4-amino-4-deoxy-L-arabinose transferase-like glycosyltransferase
VPAHRLLLTAVLALSAFLKLSWLTSEGYGNVYYAATVKNMLASWHNFFFASYDAGFVSVDKPPLGFWIQAASAELFGFHGWSVLLPQALAGSSLRGPALPPRAPQLRASGRLASGARVGSHSDQRRHEPPQQP